MHWSLHRLCCTISSCIINTAVTLYRLFSHSESCACSRTFTTSVGSVTSVGDKPCLQSATLNRLTTKLLLVKSKNWEAACCSQTSCSPGYDLRNGRTQSRPNKSCSSVRHCNWSGNKSKGHVATYVYTAKYSMSKCMYMFNMKMNV